MVMEGRGMVMMVFTVRWVGWGLDLKIIYQIPINE